MADSMNFTLDEQISRLRAELKEWEHAFATKNEGRKAGREDIKREPDIGSFRLLCGCLLFIFRTSGSVQLLTSSPGSCKVQNLRATAGFSDIQPAKR
jgi:hypothetical protein